MHPEPLTLNPQPSTIRDEDSSFGDAPQKPRAEPPRAEKAEKGRADKRGGFENRGEEGGEAASSNEESVSFNSGDVYSEGGSD